MKRLRNFKKELYGCWITYMVIPVQDVNITAINESTNYTCITINKKDHIWKSKELKKPKHRW